MTGDERREAREKIGRIHTDRIGTGSEKRL